MSSFRNSIAINSLPYVWCRKLADVTRDNVLDISEFAVALHLIQSRLRGMDIPKTLPQNLMPIHIPQLVVPAMTQEERDAYEKTFAWKDKDKNRLLDGMMQCFLLFIFIPSVGGGLYDGYYCNFQLSHPLKEAI